MYATINHNSPSQSIPSMTGKFSTFGNVSDSSSPLSYASIPINDTNITMSNENSNINPISRIEKSILRWRSKHDEHKEQYKEAAAQYINESRKDVQRQHYKYLEDMIRKHQEFLVIRPEDVSRSHTHSQYKWMNNQKRNYYPNMSFNSQGPSYYQPNISSNNNVNNVSQNYYNYPDSNIYFNYPESNMYSNYSQPMVNYDVRNDSQFVSYPGHNEEIYSQQGNFSQNPNEKFW
uniref:HMG box domain-containing protein n=1 Tax=Strongyloides stercoralis TaxID=6248 RepID=A0A0K0E979_STRER